jgi:GST-like protein
MATRKGERYVAMSTALIPNAKGPVIVDGATTVFDSKAIVLFLAEKTGRFLPAHRTVAPCARG